MAGRLWSQYLQDDAVFDIHVAKTDDLPPTVVGGALPSYVVTDLATVQSALSQDATSTDDAIATANLNTESDPNGFTQYRAILGDTPYQSSNLSLTHANAKALGLGSLVTPNSVDGYVLFNSLDDNSFTWDYNFSRTSASSSRQIDFLSMAVHELGHIMGFISGVDVMGGITNQANFGQTSLLDLFRYSDRSTEQNARELTAGRDAYFSIDGGQTQLASMASGLISVPGGVEGYQASHWAYQAPNNSNLTPEVPEFDLNTALLDLINISAPVTTQDAELAEALYTSNALYNSEIDIGSQTNTTILENVRQATYKSLGVMDPALVPGFRSNISNLDLQALDVIGYNLTNPSLSPDYATLLRETQTALTQEVGVDVSTLSESLEASSLVQDRQSGLSEAIENSQSLFERRRSRVRRRRLFFWQEDGLDPSVVNIVSDGAGDIAQVAASEGRTQVTTVQAIPYAQLFYRSDTLIGSDADDYIYPVIPGNEVLSIDAGSGNNMVVLGKFEADVTADEGDDTIIGVDSRNSVQNIEKGYTVNAGEGNNYVYLTSERAAVNVVTGNGNDYISVGSNNNVVETSGGNNQIYSYGLFGLGIRDISTLTVNAGIPDLRLPIPGSNKISTGDGNDSIFLLTKDATVTTTGGDNIIHLQGPRNSRIELTAGDGNDEVILVGDAGVVDVGDGNNVVTITSSPDSLGLSADGFSVTTGNGSDVVRLSVAQANVFTGGGDDIIDLAAGQQAITTGAGNDLIILGDRQGSYTRFGTQATIADFSDQDTLLLHGAQQDYQFTSDSLLYRGQRLASFANGVDFSLESAQVVFTETNSGAALAEQVGAGPDSFEKPRSPLNADNENRPFEERYNTFREERPFRYAIAGGDDADLFGINPITGDVQFKVAPNVRTPLDADGDNIYDVIVQASLGEGQTRRNIDTQRLAIEVASNLIGNSTNPALSEPSEPQASQTPIEQEQPQASQPPIEQEQPQIEQEDVINTNATGGANDVPTEGPNGPANTDGDVTPISQSITETPPSLSIPLSEAQILGDSGDNLLQGSEGDDVIASKGGSDAILAGAGNDLVRPTDSLSRGVGENDYVDLGLGEDIVVLGDMEGSYYSANGWADSVYIDGFTVGEDKLVLAGSADQYLVQSTAEGSWVLLGNDFSTAVAYLNGIAAFDLTGNSVNYVGATNAGSAVTENNITESATTESAITESTVTTELDLSPTDASLPATDTAAPPEIGTASTPLPASDIVFAADNTIRGTIGNDTLVGTLASDRLLGLGGNDYLEGGDGADQFVLGDTNGSFYVQAAWSDHAYIEDFEVGVDQLVLHGSASQYTAEGDSQGSMLYAGNDYIAYLKGVTNFDLNAAKNVSWVA